MNKARKSFIEYHTSILEMEINELNGGSRLLNITQVY